MLAGECWPLCIDADPVRSMAGRASRRSLGWCYFPAASGNGAEARQVRRDILNLLVAQARSLCLHGWVRTFATTIALKRDDQVTGLLAAELRNSIRGIGITIALDAVASEAGIAEFPSGLRIALGDSGLC